MALGLAVGKPVVDEVLQQPGQQAPVPLLGQRYLCHPQSALSSQGLRHILLRQRLSGCRFLPEHQIEAAAQAPA